MSGLRAAQGQAARQAPIPAHQPKFTAEHSPIPAQQQGMGWQRAAPSPLLPVSCRDTWREDLDTFSVPTPQEQPFPNSQEEQVLLSDELQEKMCLCGLSSALRIEKGRLICAAVQCWELHPHLWQYRPALLLHTQHQLQRAESAKHFSLQALLVSHTFSPTSRHD